MICKEDLNKGEEKTIATKSIKSSTVFMKVQVTSPNATCVFSYSEDGINYTPIGQPFVARQDKWIGAKIGLFAVSSPDVRMGGYADFDYFRIDK